MQIDNNVYNDTVMASQSIFKTYHDAAKKGIETELNNVSLEWNKYVRNNFSELKDINKQFTNNVFGGKLIRGTLVRLGYDLIQNKYTNAIFKPAAAFEMLHSALLIHDDIIDQSPIRREKPAIHMHKDNHYGISQAICLGDLGIALAVQMVTESDFPVKNKYNALNYFLQIVIDTILGEMLDVNSAHINKRTEKQILRIQKMKTAQYTIVGPLSVGALLAGATDTFLETIKQFGEPLGIAYQMQDDILGIFGDEKTIGKSTTSDIEENKSTLLITYALKHADKEQAAILEKYYGRKEITLGQRGKIKKVFIETGALAYSEDKIKNLTSKTQMIIPQLTKHKKQQTLLLHLCDLLLNRST